MSEKDYGVFLFDIVRAILAIKEYTQGQTFDDFAHDRKTFDAVVRNFQIVGEALKKMPHQVLAPYDTIKWKDIKGMRDIVVHDYNDIDPRVVWDVIADELDDLLTVVRQIQKDTGK